MTNLDQSQALSLVPGRGTLAGESHPCVFGQSVTGDRTWSLAPYVTEGNRRRRRGHQGARSSTAWWSFPRQHIGGIDGLSVPGRAASSPLSDDSRNQCRNGIPDRPPGSSS